MNIHKKHIDKNCSLPILGIMLSMTICWCCFATAAENESAIFSSAKVLSEEKDWLESREKLGNLRQI